MTDGPAGPERHAQHDFTLHHASDEVSDGEDAPDGLPLLARGTKVLVSGNQRSKAALVGMQGVVKKAVGLGGWHWLVLTTGEEVRLQRNALSVLEPPTGDEGFDSDSEDANGADPSSSRQRPKRPRGPSGAHTALPPLSHPHTPADPATDQQPDPTVPPPPRRHSDRRREPGLPSYPHTGGSLVNFSRLGLSALRKYRAFYGLRAAPGGGDPTKEQLVVAVSRHFASHLVAAQEASLLASVARESSRRAHCK